MTTENPEPQPLVLCDAIEVMNWVTDMDSRLCAGVTETDHLKRMVVESVTAVHLLDERERMEAEWTETIRELEEQEPESPFLPVHRWSRRFERQRLTRRIQEQLELLELLQSYLDVDFDTND